MAERPYTLLSCGISLDGYLDAAGLTRDDVVKLRAALRG